jgi:hypothetical protein
MVCDGCVWAVGGWKWKAWLCVMGMIEVGMIEVEMDDMVCV